MWLALIGALMACKSNDAGESAGNAVPTTVVSLSKAAVRGSSQMHARNRAEMLLISEVYPPTFDFGDCGAPSSSVYTDWALAEDGLSMDLTLRHDMRWSNGVLVTAEDATRIFYAYREAYSSAAIPGLKDNSPTVTGTHSIRFEFNKPFHESAAIAMIASRLYPADADLIASDFAERGHPVIGDWQFAGGPENGLAVQATNDNQAVRRLELRYLPDYRDRILALSRGEADYVEDISLTDIANLREEGVSIHRHRGTQQVFLTLNFDLPMFQDRSVRRALRAATDSEAIVDALYTVDGERFARATAAPFPERACVPAFAAPDFGDPREILAQSGWEDTDGDGYLDRNGEKLVLRLLLSSGNPARARIATLVQAQWKDHGIHLEIDKRPQPVTFSLVQERNFEIVMLGEGLRRLPGLNPWHTFSDGKPHIRNHGHVDIPALNAAIESANVTGTPEAWDAAQQVFANEVPAILLLQSDRVVGTSARWKVENITVDHPYGTLSAWTPAEQ